jgi:tRNA(Leu) C34 or U34 (ribose-2'-O)-methylase TrmL
VALQQWLDEPRPEHEGDAHADEERDEEGPGQRAHRSTEAPGRRAALGQADELAKCQHGISDRIDESSVHADDEGDGAAAHPWNHLSDANEDTAGEVHDGALHRCTVAARVARVAEDTAGKDVAGGVGLGPYPGPWPDDPRLDPELLEHGDRRNVVDAYRYWRLEAIVADLDERRHPFHVAIENFSHDFNIGSVVRTANAFLAREVHIVGRRRWNRRGAMVTDRYQHVRHHESADDLASWAADQGLPLIGIDNLSGAVPLETADLPEACVLLFGQEGEGLSEQARQAVTGVLSIAQYGSTRSINAGAAAAIAMHAWIRQHRFGQTPRPS